MSSSIGLAIGTVATGVLGDPGFACDKGLFDRDADPAALYAAHHRVVGFDPRSAERRSHRAWELDVRFLDLVTACRRARYGISLEAR